MGRFSQTETRIISPGTRVLRRFRRFRHRLGWQPGKSPLETPGYWDMTECKQPIIVKESLTLLCTFQNLLHTHSNTRINAFVDNKALLASL